MSNGVGFVEQFELYHKTCTDAPPEFGRLLAIQILGHAMGYQPRHLIQPSAVRHNMYLGLVGKSTVTRKSTSQDMAKYVYPLDRALSEEVTPEQLTVDLSEEPEQIQWLGEFTGLLKGVTGRGYMARLVELYNDLHGCPRLYRRKIRGTKGSANYFEIEKAYLSLNSTTTPEMLKKHITDELVEGGFLARWLLVKGEPKPRPRGKLSPNVEYLKKGIQDTLLAVVKMDNDVMFEFSDEAFERFHEIEVEAYAFNEALPFAGRYLNYVVSIADILLISDAIGEAGEKLYTLSKLIQLQHYIQLIRLGKPNGEKGINHTNRLIVSKEYVDRAWVIVKPCLEFADELIRYVKFDYPTAKLMDIVKKYGRISHSVAMRNTGLTAKQMAAARTTLEQMGLITVEVVAVERKGRGTIQSNYYTWEGDAS